MSIPFKVTLSYKLSAPFCLPRQKGDISSPGNKPVEVCVVEILDCPVIRIPLSAALVESRGVDWGESSSAAGRMARLTSDPLWGSTPDLVLGFTPLHHSINLTNECYLPLEGTGILSVRTCPRAGWPAHSTSRYPVLSQIPGTFN